MLRLLRKVVVEEDLTDTVTGTTIKGMTTELLGICAGDSVQVLPLSQGQTLRFECIIMIA